MDQQDRIKLAQKRHELLQACEDLRLPVSSGDSIETLELYIKTAYDEFAENKSDKNNTWNMETVEEINIVIGKSKVKSFLGRILPFL